MDTKFLNSIMYKEEMIHIAANISIDTLGALIPLLSIRSNYCYRFLNSRDEEDRKSLSIIIERCNDDIKALLAI